MSQVLDSGELWQRFDHDQAFLSELAGLFFETSSLMLAQVSEAARCGDRQTVIRVAHSLKGVVSNFAARPAFEAARRLEEVARHDNLARMTEASTNLETEVQRLCTALHQISRTGVQGRVTVS